MIRKVPLGKRVKTALYFHSMYLSEMINNGTIPLRDIDLAEEIVKRSGLLKEAGVSSCVDLGNVVKWDSYHKKISFIFCPGFDWLTEPTIAISHCVNLNTMKVRKIDYEYKNAPIYHHKWLMVKDDYEYFSVSFHKARSMEIEKVIEKHNIDKRKIGSKKYWDEVVMPIILRERFEEIYK